MAGVPEFVKSSLIKAPVEVVFAFHEREDALPLLSPRFPPMTVVSRTGGIRAGARVGANTTLLPGVEIGREAFVAAGSVVTRDVPPATLVMGVPARPVRSVQSDR